MRTPTYKVSSRRALRPDPQFDQLVQAFYPDILMYEEKEDEFITRQPVGT
ncbi:hypothetical protein T484DRAFT_1856900 [Baffinella frigidus]|nr:hypothetical protein T484DRAFT_1856900 [Cryptophyta sp. CCMP2293]